MLLNFIFIILAASPAWSQRTCSRDRMRQCEDTLRRNTQRRINNMNQQEMSEHCKTVRDDFNCLLRETRCLTSENERNRNGDTIRNALKYIREGCDTSGSRWRDNSCFMSDSMKSCERSYPLGGSQYASYNPENCRKYNLFQRCAMDHVRDKCRPEDERFFGQYLVDTAQDLAWNCADSTSSDLDRNKDDVYDRDRNDRDRGDNSYRGSDSRRTDYRDRDYSRDRDRDYSRDRDRDRYSDSYDRNSGGYDRNGGGYDRNGGGYDRNGGGYDRYNSGNDRNNRNPDFPCCRNERCSTSRLQQCRDSLSRTIDSRISGYQDSEKCRQTRDDFNCLLWQTSSCTSRNERDQDNDIFRRARDYISRNCDSYGRWSDNSCYKSSEMQRCENNLSLSRGANYEACRAYNNFRNCMQDELQRRCTREDDLYQGAYLIDKAQELSWQCSDDNNNGRDRYFTNDNRRDRYDTNSGAYNSPLHLDDDDAMCLSRIQAYSDQCKATLDEKRRDIYITNEHEARQRITCCSAQKYRNCLYDATRRVCQNERSRVVDSLMGRYGYELSTDACRRIYDSDCNNSNNFQISYVLLLLCTIMSQFFIYRL